VIFCDDTRRRYDTYIQFCSYLSAGVYFHTYLSVEVYLPSVCSYLSVAFYLFPACSCFFFFFLFGVYTSVEPKAMRQAGAYFDFLGFYIDLSRSL